MKTSVNAQKYSSGFFGEEFEYVHSEGKLCDYQRKNHVDLVILIVTKQ